MTVDRGTIRADDTTPQQPGVVPLRPLAVTEVLDGAVRVVWSQRRTVFLVTTPFAVVSALIQLAVGYADRRHASPLGFTLPALAQATLLPVVLGTVLTTLLAPAVSGALTGTGVDAAASARALARRLPAILVLGVLTAVGLGVASLLFLVPGVLLWGRWAVAAPAAAMEGLGPVAALRRSWRLVRGSLGRVWGTRALGWAVTRVVGLLAVVPFTLLAAFATGDHTLNGSAVDRPLLYLVLLAVGQLVAAIASMPISAAVDVLIYADLRMRREGMDLLMTLPPVAPS